MAALYIGASPDWFVQNRAQLEARGFPVPLPVVGGYDRQAIDGWLDAQGRLTAPRSGGWDSAAK